MGNTTTTPKGKMKLMPMGGIQDENGDYVMESFVIRACNSHQPLMDALEPFTNMEADPTLEEARAMYEAACAALKLARGE